MDIRTLRNLSSKLVMSEERDKFFGNLTRLGIGVKEVEDFARKNDDRVRNLNSKLKGKQRRELVAKAMDIKLMDNKGVMKKLRTRRNQLLKKLEDDLGHRSRLCRWVRRSTRENCDKLRTRVRKKFAKKFEFLKGKYEEKNNPMDTLNEDDQMKYKDAKIFSMISDMRMEDDEEPTVVCLRDEDVVLSDDEKSVLALGPKFCVFNNLSEENFQREVEECVVKYRWELRREEKEIEEIKKFGEEQYEAIEGLFDDDELRQQDEEDMLEEARKRMYFDPDKVSLNFAKKRASDLKGNSRVFLPKRVKSFDMESKLEMMRVECYAVFRQYMDEKCGKNGRQKSNLSKSQLKGLLSLKKRIKNAEIVVVPTDKTGKFSVMSRASYEQAGLVHTKGDTVAGWDVVGEAQREVNGHVSMLLKIFKVGEYWENNVDRVRETMLGEGLSVCPITLLFKDHKGWDNNKSSVPPTRHVAGGHVGLNMNLSEVVSDILEPMVSTIGGRI